PAGARGGCRIRNRAWKRRSARSAPGPGGDRADFGVPCSVRERGRAGGGKVRSGRLMSRGPEIVLRLPAEAQNVALVRQALSGIGESLAVDRSLLADMKTAVTEACNNVG